MKKVGESWERKTNKKNKEKETKKLVNNEQATSLFYIHVYIFFLYMIK